jgi:hypothetical protein
VSHAKVAVSIHRASAGSGTGADAPAGRRWIPYSRNSVAFAATLVTVLALALYVRTMLPSTGFWDTGEAQTVPPTLSIFHPTGFPFYTLLGWAWSQLPIGEVAWRMNLLSAVSVSLTAGLVTLITGHLVTERHRWLSASAVTVAGLAFAFASEPWQNGTRADVHAINVLFVALVVWLLLAWDAARRAGHPRAGRWLAAAAAAFGLGLATHPLSGLTAFGIAAWLLVVDPEIWRRWRLVAGSAALIGIGIALYGTIYLRAIVEPTPPLFYAHPNTWENFRYLVFAEQFRGLFEEFGSPLADLWRKWAGAERVLAAQLPGPGWLLVAMGAAVTATRRPGVVVFFGLVAVATVLYAVNFRDGDIDRYYLPVLVVTLPFLGVAVGAIGAAAASALAEVGRRVVASRAARRRLAGLAGAIVVTLGAALPVASLVTGYEANDQSRNREADAWVASIHARLPPNAVIISWWSYSTPLWYHRWVLGERPDVTIVDERNIIDEGYRTMNNAIRTYLGERPVYVVPPHWEWAELTREWSFRSVSTYPGYTDLLHIEGPRQ